jgi:sphinganine C4-monooxygenase
MKFHPLHPFLLQHPDVLTLGCHPGFFHFLDLSSAPWLVRRRIHDLAEVATRNRVSRAQVLRAVILQQVI